MKIGIQLNLRSKLSKYIIYIVSFHADPKNEIEKILFQTYFYMGGNQL